MGRGYDGVRFGPTNSITPAQVISFITRAMVLNGYWVQKADNPALYPNIPGSSGHRTDIATYVFYAGVIPGTATTTQNSASSRAAPASRAWYAQAEWLQ